VLELCLSLLDLTFWNWCLNWSLLATWNLAWAGLNFLLLAVAVCNCVYSLKLVVSCFYAAALHGSWRWSSAACARAHVCAHPASKLQVSGPCCSCLSGASRDVYACVAWTTRRWKTERLENSSDNGDWWILMLILEPRIVAEPKSLYYRQTSSVLVSGLRVGERKTRRSPTGSHLNFSSRTLLNCLLHSGTKLILPKCDNARYRDWECVPARLFLGSYTMSASRCITLIRFPTCGCQ